MYHGDLKVNLYTGPELEDYMQKNPGRDWETARCRIGLDVSADTG